MGKTSVRRGIEKNIKKEILSKIYYSIGKNNLSAIANSSKNLLLRLIFDP